MLDSDDTQSFADKLLWRDQCYINGKWQSAAGGEVIEVTNPATGKLIGNVPKMGREETRKAIDYAMESFPSWAAMTAKEQRRSCSLNDPGAG